MLLRWKATRIGICSLQMIAAWMLLATGFGEVRAQDRRLDFRSQNAQHENDVDLVRSNDPHSLISGTNTWYIARNSLFRRFDETPDVSMALPGSVEKPSMWLCDRPMGVPLIQATRPQRLGLPVLCISDQEFDEAPELADRPDYCTGIAAPERLSFWNDFRTSPTWLTEDLRSLATWENAAFLSVAAGGAIALRQHVDAEVQQSVANQGGYWGNSTRWLNHAGESVVHIPLLAGLYSYSLYTQNEDLHELTLTFVASYKFAAISTLILQYATDTRHGKYGGLSMLQDSGFPSMPASTSFALAAVVEEKYGWRAGLPAYVGAGLIGWAGIDQQQHRVSDVVFGAALGYAIGKSIGALHYNPDARFKLVPFVDTATGSQGLMVTAPF